MDYKTAGVDIEAGYKSVELMKEHVKKTMREEVLLKNVPEGYFSWSPTEDYLIYMLTDEGEKVSGPLKRLLHPDDRIPNSRDRYYLMKYDVATGLSERLTYGSHNVYLNDISPEYK